jgi:hypothetical protein
MPTPLRGAAPADDGELRWADVLGRRAAADGSLTFAAFSAALRRDVALTVDDMDDTELGQLWEVTAQQLAQESPPRAGLTTVDGSPLPAFAVASFLETSVGGISLFETRPPLTQHEQRPASPPRRQILLRHNQRAGTGEGAEQGDGAADSGQAARTIDEQAWMALQSPRDGGRSNSHRRGSTEGESSSGWNQLVERQQHHQRGPRAPRDHEELLKVSDARQRQGPRQQRSPSLPLDLEREVPHQRHSRREPAGAIHRRRDGGGRRRMPPPRRGVHGQRRQGGTSPPEHRAADQQVLSLLSAGGTLLLLPEVEEERQRRAAPERIRGLPAPARLLTGRSDALALVDSDAAATATALAVPSGALPSPSPSAAAPPPQWIEAVFASNGPLGLALSMAAEGQRMPDLGGNARGLLVREIRSDSPAAAVAGLRTGMQAAPPQLSQADSHSACGLAFGANCETNTSCRHATRNGGWCRYFRPVIRVCAA